MVRRRRRRRAEPYCAHSRTRACTHACSCAWSSWLGRRGRHRNRRGRRRRAVLRSSSSSTSLADDALAQPRRGRRRRYVPCRAQARTHAVHARTHISCTHAFTRAASSSSSSTSCRHRAVLAAPWASAELLSNCAVTDDRCNRRHGAVPCRARTDGPPASSSSSPSSASDRAVLMHARALQSTDQLIVSQRLFGFTNNHVSIHTDRRFDCKLSQASAGNIGHAQLSLSR